MEEVAQILYALAPSGAPLDLIKSMYATPQPAELLEDIRSFTTGLDQVYAIYSARWPLASNNDDHDTWDWLSNDLISYMNLQQASMYGYVDSFYKCWDKYLPDKIWGWNPRIARRTTLFLPFNIPKILFGFFQKRDFSGDQQPGRLIPEIMASMTWSPLITKINTCRFKPVIFPGQICLPSPWILICSESVTWSCCIISWNDLPGNYNWTICMIL